jgi:hypothetical protein
VEAGDGHIQCPCSGSSGRWSMLTSSTTPERPNARFSFPTIVVEITNGTDASRR